MEPGETLPLSQLAFLMLALSDNHASLWIQGLLGGGEVVNAWMAEHGFEHTRVNSRTPGRADAQAEYGWGQTSPREIAETLVMLREGRAVSPDASEETSIPTSIPRIPGSPVNAGRPDFPSRP